MKTKKIKIALLILFGTTISLISCKKYEAKEYCLKPLIENNTWTVYKLSRVNGLPRETKLGSVTFGPNSYVSDVPLWKESGTTQFVVNDRCTHKVTIWMYTPQGTYGYTTANDDVSISSSGEFKSFAYFDLVKTGGDTLRLGKQ